MTARIPKTWRPRGTLRAQIVAGLGLAALLILLAGFFLIRQVTLLNRAVQKMNEETERLVVMLDTADRASELLLLVEENIVPQDREQFVAAVNPAIAALENMLPTLQAQFGTLPEEDPLHYHFERVVVSLQNVINVAQGTVHHVEIENWPAAQMRVSLLRSRRRQVDADVTAMAEEVRSRHTAANTQVNHALRQTLSAPTLLSLVALSIGALVAFATVRSVARGLEQLGQSARRLAEGHFDERIAVVRKDELGQLANSFNAMAEQLQSLYTSLEQRVAERTTDLQQRSVQLETAAQVAREAAAIRDVDQLLNTAVRLISERFDFYHAGIFLIDDAREYALLQAASSEGGQRMLTRRHRLKVGETGIVGYVADAGEPRIALDVGADAVYFDNPDLPLTRSEMALPLRVRDRIIGVLDVQSTEPAAFSDEDVATLQTLVDQVAMAIENAHLLEESQHALRELEALYGRRAREAWRERTARQPAAYHYTGVGVEPTSPARASERVTFPSSAQLVALPEGDGHQLVAPIRLRGQALGSIVLRQDPEQVPWSPEEIALVDEVSTQIALALENARLLEETRRRAEREQTLGQMAARFTRSLDMDAVLQSAVRELGQLPNVAEASVHLGPPEKVAASTHEGEEMRS